MASSLHVLLEKIIKTGDLTVNSPGGSRTFGNGAGKKVVLNFTDEAAMQEIAADPALKLAEMEVLTKEKNFRPLLLLDDVFEKLDESRISNLLHKVCMGNEGQVFITDTNEERLRQHLERVGAKFGIISL